MTDANDSQREFIAKTAFLLMVGGVLVPLIIALLPGISLLVVGFAFLSEVLALVLGIVCRRELLGKVAMFGAGTLLALAVLVCPLFVTTVRAIFRHFFCGCFTAPSSICNPNCTSLRQPPPRPSLPTPSSADRLGTGLRSQGVGGLLQTVVGSQMPRRRLEGLPATMVARAIRTG